MKQPVVDVIVQPDLETDLEYRSAEAGLNFSGMKDLAISPLRYWHRHVNPDRIEEPPTSAQEFGSAVHCAVLRPADFAVEYARELTDAEYPDGCLRTIKDLREWLESKGVKPRGTVKADIIAQAMAVDPTIAVLEIEQARHASENGGKVILSAEDFDRVQRCAGAIRSEPAISKILNDPEGRAEVRLMATDPETGVRMKGILDWVTPTLTLDLKTFSATRGTPIDQAIANAIYCEGYHKQAYWYTMLRRRQPGCERKDFPFVLAFVESEEPYETRVMVLRPTTAGQPNLYWEHARIQCGQMTRLFAKCMEHYGERPWRREITEPEPLLDEDIRQLAYA